MLVFICLTPCVLIPPAQHGYITKTFSGMTLEYVVDMWCVTLTPEIMLCFEVSAPPVSFYSLITGNVSLNSFRVSFHFCTFMYLWWSNSSIILYDPFETCWVQLILRTVSWKLTTLCYTPSRKTCTHIGSNLQRLRPVETLCWVCAIVCVWFVYLLCAQVRDRRRECSCLSVYVCWSFCCK